MEIARWRNNPVDCSRLQGKVPSSIDRMKLDEPMTYSSKASKFFDILGPGRIDSLRFSLWLSAHYVECVVIFQRMLSALRWHSLAIDQ